MTTGDAPPPPAPAPYTLDQPGHNSAPTTSLVLGLISLIANVLLIPTIAGIAVGIHGIRVGEDVAARRRSIWGIALSVLGLVTSAGIIMLVRALAEFQ
ncbi:hypothetical protein [Glaciibacter flavus]|uniref:hypothetical protein n=1 Tax=Orlajensenia flava TaxID=2565934 RepID=UPI003AFF7B78